MREQMGGIRIVARPLGYAAVFFQCRLGGRIEIEFFHLAKYMAEIVEARYNAG
mgnify:CR=1 FL=1